VSDAYRPTVEEPEDLDVRERNLFTRLRNDFAFYAPRALRIRPKAGSIVPFTLNSAQRRVHEEIEKQRAATGLVRVVCLKGRQQGISTYAQGRFFWRLTHSPGFRAFILTHMDSTTDNLFGMVERFYEYCPAELKPKLGSNNAKELNFAKLNSGYKVATAGARGVGVGDTLQLFHGSECSKWPNAESHISGALQAVPYERGTEVILESTSDGPTGVFYDLCNAAKMGESDYKLIFVPWFLQSEYRRPVPEGFEVTGEEQVVQEQFGLDLAQVAWRRAKIRELRSLQEFRRQYPATYEEAWAVDSEGALWKRSQLDGCRVTSLPEMKRVVVAIDPSGGTTKRSDECGIVVAGLGFDGRGYVLHDGSGKLEPADWGKRAIALYERFQADRIIAENNFGGAMVESTIRAINPRVPFSNVNASRGKAQRAEPVAALYSDGRVSHFGMFAALEDELVTWLPGSSRSPNRLDALVWCITELMLQDMGSYDRSLRWVSEGASVLSPTYTGVYGLF
jgi:hypothetical protein